MDTGASTHLLGSTFLLCSLADDVAAGMTSWTKLSRLF